MVSKAKVQPKARRRRSLGVRAIDALIAHPSGTGGAVVMAAMASAILVNALAMQPGPHPAPLFHGTRPFGDVAARPVEPARATADELDDLVSKATGRPSAADTTLVAEIQSTLKQLGYYDGTVDGLAGPMTSMAVLAFEKDHGLTPIGEPSGDVLEALRAASGAEPQAPVEETAAPGPTPVAVPRPRPGPRAETAVEADDGLADLIETASLVRSEEPAAPAAATPAAATGTIGTPAAAAAAPVAATPPADAGADPRLARIQEALDLLGFGPLKADGLWSPSTEAAIRRFEAYRGLPETGRLSERVLTDLVRIGGLSVD